MGNVIQDMSTYLVIKSVMIQYLLDILIIQESLRHVILLAIVLPAKTQLLSVLPALLRISKGTIVSINVIQAMFQSIEYVSNVIMNALLAQISRVTAQVAMRLVEYNYTYQIIDAKNNALIIHIPTLIIMYVKVV